MTEYAQKSWADRLFTAGREAVVASGAAVTHGVSDGMVFAGISAKSIRERDAHGRHGHGLDKIWLN